MISLSGRMKNSLTNFKKDKPSPIIITSDSWGESNHDGNSNPVTTAGTDDKDWESGHLTSPSFSSFTSSKSSHTHHSSDNSSISYKSMEFGFGAFKFGTTNNSKHNNTSGSASNSSSTSTFHSTTDTVVRGSEVTHYNVFGRSLQEVKEIDSAYETIDPLVPMNETDSSYCTTELLQYIPLVILKCMRFISENGLEEEGLYRISGSSIDVKGLRERFMKGEYQCIPFIWLTWLNG
jgi:hypothetical protein